LTSWSLALVLASGLRTLVLPFENLSGDRAQDWKGSALEEAIGSHLESAGLNVVELTARNRQLLEKGLTPGEPITRASAIVLGKDLGADRLVLGEFRPVGDRLEVTARLIDLNRGATVGVVDDFGEPAKLSRLANQVAKNLFRLERDHVPASFDFEAERRQKIPPAALESAARARTELDPAQQKALLTKALSSHPDYLEVRLLLGGRLLEEGLPREATEILAAARGRGLLYERAYFELGLAYLRASEPRLAYEVFRNLVDAEGARAASYNNLGVALMRLDRIPEAVQTFEKARELGSGHTTCLFNLAWAQWRAGKGAIAFDLFEKLAAQDPIDAEAHFVLAEAAVSQARPDVAERSRATALVLAPHLEAVDVRTISNWERTLDAIDAVEAPSNYLPFAAEIEIEEDVFGLAELLDARELRARGRNDEAIQVLQRSLYRDPNDTGSRRELADIYRERGELEEALSELSIVLWAEPSAETHVRLARVYLQMQEPGKAVEEVEKALQLDPDHPGARGLRSEIAQN
jgi:tetratricopeptide (TPR) repeat protein/TolB-like protein